MQNDIKYCTEQKVSDNINIINSIVNEDKANIWYPKTNIGCPPSPANRTSTGYVETHSIPNLNIFKWGSIILEVWFYLNHKDISTSVQTLAACSISRDCTFARCHKPCPSQGGSWRRQATHIVTGHFYEVQTLMMMLPIQCWSRIYTRHVLCQHFSCWCSSTSWRKVIGRDTDDYIVLRVFLAF